MPPLPDHLGWHTIGDAIVRNIVHNYGTRTNYAIAPDRNAVRDCRSDAHKGELADRNSPPQNHARRKLRSIMNRTVVIDDRARIDDNIRADLRPRLHDTPGAHHSTPPDLHVVTDDSARMRNCAELKAR